MSPSRFNLFQALNIFHAANWRMVPSDANNFLMSKVLVLEVIVNDVPVGLKTC